jgi:hypothetical protein
LKKIDQMSMFWITIPQTRSPHHIWSIYNYTIRDYMSACLKKRTL